MATVAGRVVINNANYLVAPFVPVSDPKKPMTEEELWETPWIVKSTANIVYVSKRPPFLILGATDDADQDVSAAFLLSPLPLYSRDNILSPPKEGNLLSRYGGSNPFATGPNTRVQVRISTGFHSVLMGCLYPGTEDDMEVVNWEYRGRLGRVRLAGGSVLGLGDEGSSVLCPHTGKVYGFVVRCNQTRNSALVLLANDVVDHIEAVVAGEMALAPRG